MKRTYLLIALAAAALLLASLACNQAGEIISPAEATQRFIATEEASVVEVGGDAEGAAFLAGDSAKLAGSGYLVALYTNPGDTVQAAFATRGDVITVNGSLIYEDTIWYNIKSLTGVGWLPEENLAPVE